MAAELASDSPRLGRIRQMMAHNRVTVPLFDTGRYIKDLEAAYEVVYDRHHLGAAPRHVNDHLAD